MHYLVIGQILLIVVWPLVKMVLKAIGFGFVSYVGINLVIDQAKSFIQSQISGVGQDVLAILGLMKFDIAVNIMLAAVVTRFVLAGLNKATDSKRNSVWRAPSGKGGGGFEA